MQEPIKNTSVTGKHEHPLPAETSKADDKAVRAAHDTADADMETDADLSTHNANDDLDEGETARLGEGENELI